MTELQASNEWYDLRHHVEEITDTYIRFRFSLENAPKINEDVFNRLKAHFGELEIETPIIEKPSNGVYVEYEHRGDMIVTLTFKTPELIGGGNDWLDFNNKPERDKFYNDFKDAHS